VAAELPELLTRRLAVRLARPGMQAAMARFLRENFRGHLERWSPPATPAFFSEAFWGERLGKTEMRGYQASLRGGVVLVRLNGERVGISGQAVTTLRAELVV